jgi:hypothetical protein
MKIQTLILWTLLLTFPMLGCEDEGEGGSALIQINTDAGGRGDMAVLDGTGSQVTLDMGLGNALLDMASSVADSAVLEPDVAAPVAPGQCVDGAPYQRGTNAFVERTTEWKLDRAAVMGNRITVGDIDGDGFADLIVRSGGQKSDIFSNTDIGRRFHWVLKNRGNAFQDVTVQSGFSAVRGSYGLTVGRPSEVVVFGDFDNDGDQDIYSGLDSRRGVRLEPEGEEPIDVRERSELLINDGTGVFSLADADHPLRRVGLEDVPSGASWVDYNLDGNLDIWMSQGGLGAPNQDRLYVGDGRGGFEDVTRLTGLETRPWQLIADINGGLAHTTAWSAVACDLNRDGYAELLAGSYGRAPNHLWRSQGVAGAIEYINRSVASGYAYDTEEAWQDNQFARCYCQGQRAAPDCADVPAPNINCHQMNWRHDADREAFRNGGNSGATVCADLNNDGWMDLYTTEIRHWWAGEGSDGSEVLVNQRSPEVEFTRPGREATGLTLPHDGPTFDEGHITAGIMDFDNDGRQDLYIGGTDYAGNRGHLYRNITEGETPRFEEMSVEEFFEHNRSHGMAVSDFDRDGDLDILVGHSRSRCDANRPNNCYETRLVRYFENVVGTENNWLQLNLVGGPGSNRSAIGAQVTVVTNGQTQTQQVGGGYGHYGAQRDRILHFGLGSACEALITIQWPNRARSTQRLRLNAGHRYRVVEGQTAAIDTPE